MEKGDKNIEQGAMNLQGVLMSPLLEDGILTYSALVNS